MKKKKRLVFILVPIVLLVAIISIFSLTRGNIGNKNPGIRASGSRPFRIRRSGRDGSHSPVAGSRSEGRR